MSKNFISTPIYYANGEPHLGHAYTSVLADALHRYAKLQQKDSFFLTGLDEHGQKILEKANNSNLPVQDFVEQYNQSFKKLYQDLDVVYDRFIRTTDKDHEEVVGRVWLKLVEQGDLYEKEYEGLYCVGCESFKTEKDLTEDGLCPDHLVKPTVLREKNWFFRLSKYSDYLKEIITSNKLEIIPSTRKNEMLEFINSGLQDISFSRSKDVVSWGIPVPNDPTQTIYVWCDALVNYITACGYGTDSSRFQEMWQDGQTLHLMGKDILKFHALYWPAMLKSIGVEAPKQILVHGMIMSGGVKMSKTIGNVISPQETLQTYNSLADKSLLGENVGSEFFRYFVLKNISPFSDGDVTMERMKELYNADLANGIGNLVNRVMKLCSMYFEEGYRPESTAFPKEYTEAMERYDVKSAFEYIFKVVSEADLYMQTSQPFKVVKEDVEKGKEMLQHLRTQVYVVGRLLNPFMPKTSELIKSLVQSNQMPEKPLFPKYE